MNEQPVIIEKYDWVTIKRLPFRKRKDGAVTNVRTFSDGTREYFVKYFRGKRWFKESEVTLLKKST